ncbi:MAG: hypothetical protein KME06_02185 [Kastovskya adunca ATA6-11-RM4]|jgi:hypothetical protein|nr:hypothetical protein [Kastovskya adunca ATA6-11-RM4]
MLIRYSDSVREIEIAANEEELLDLSKKLTENDVEINAKALGEDLNAAPYCRFLSGIQVSISSGQLVEFQVTQDGRVLLRGDRQKLSILSNVVLSFAKDWGTGEHMHIEYHPEHFYLSPNSVSVILVHTYFEKKFKVVNMNINQSQTIGQI